MIFIYTHNHSHQSGSVSVFFAIIMVVLITFLFTIFDFTRLQLIQLEASSNFESAAEMALSQYDPILFHQYGLFAGRQSAIIETVFNDALETQFYPSKAKNNDYILDYVLSSKDTLPKMKLMEPESYKFQLNYLPFLESNYQTAKQQILDYMKLRESYLFLKPFLSNLDIFAKTSKTSTIIEEKNELVSNLEHIDDYKLNLYALIDGIQVSKDGNWLLESNQSYLRKFTYNQMPNYDYIPVEAKLLFEKQVMNYKQTYSGFSKLLTTIDDKIISLLNVDPYEYIYIEDEAFEEPLFVGIVEKESTSQTIELIESLQPEIEQYLEMNTTILSLITIHEQGLKVIKEFELECEANLASINEFQKHLITKDQVIESVISQVNQELEDVKSEISVSQVSFDQVNNMKLIKEKLTSNLHNLYGALPYVENLNVALEDYIHQRFNFLKRSALISDEQLKLLEERFFQFSKDSTKVNEIVDKSTVINLQNFCDNFLSQYDSDCLFDYQMLNSKKPDDNIYEEKESDLKTFDILGKFKEYDFLDFFPELKVTEAILPSRSIIPNTMTMEEFTNLERGIKKENKLNLLDLNQVMNNLDSIHDTLLINEYAIGMFSNVSKHEDLNSKTINGYKTSEHLLHYETEYILGGSLDEQHNMNTVLGYLYATRIPLNIVHLATDASKRAIIMRIATAIAGWWTGGVGAIIIAILVGGVWALLESIADVFLLISGERVPIIKTRSTWYTSLDGNILELFTAGVQRVENEMIGYINEMKEITNNSLKNLNQLVDNQYSEASEEDRLLVKSYLIELDEKLGVLTNDLGLNIDYYNTEFDAKLYEYLNQGLKAALNTESSDYVKPANLFSDEASIDISETILTQIVEEFYKLDPDHRTLVELVECKKRYMTSFDKLIQDNKTKYKDKITNMYQETMSYEIKLLEEGVSQLMKSGTKIGRQIIVSKANEIKEQLELNIKPNETEKSFVTQLIPSFSYEDYLRLFLILPWVKEETKVARIMDLIQMNMQKMYGDYDIKLSDYYTGIEVSGSVTAKTMFIPHIQDDKLIKYWEMEVIHVSKNYE